MRIVLVLLLSLCITACGIVGGTKGPFRDRKMDYQKVETIPRIQLPEGVEMVGEADLYHVPAAQQRVEYDGEKFKVPEPPQLVVLGSNESEQADQPAPDPENTKVLLARDGNGHPIIMVHTQFHWVWEMVEEALPKTDLEVDDRNRESGIFFIKLDKRYDVEAGEAQIKLSHTMNGIQIAVLNNKGTALLDKGPAQDILQNLYDQL